MIKVVIGEDHPIFREGIKKLLARRSDIRMVGEAGDLESLVHLIDELHPDVVVLDIALGDADGLNILDRTWASPDKVKVLVLTMHPEEHYAIPALKRGAAGFLNKIATADELVQAIRTVSSGSIYLSQKVSQQLLRPLPPDEDSIDHRLTGREREVFALLASGHSIKQVASAMGITVSTVNTYRNRIAEKTGLTTTFEIVRHALVDSHGTSRGEA